MKSYAKYILLFVSMAFVGGCSSTKAVGEAEMSRGDNGSRVGISNMGDGPEMYGSIRTGVSFK
ncbi:MAG: hypothetical protein ACRCXK_09135 [Wohlfahrtiimonas sp.]